MSASTRKIDGELWLTLLSAGFVCSVLAAVFIAKPGHGSIFPPCVFHALTGFYCPGCGSTRALYLLVHGHPWMALHENALVLVALPYVIWELSTILFRRSAGVSTRLAPGAMWAVTMVVVVFWILRNVPATPFTYLAPFPLQ